MRVPVCGGFTLLTLGNNLLQKKILITGGTSALGACFVRQALGEGARVFFTYHQHRAEAESLERIGASGFHLDLSVSRNIDAFAETFAKQTPALDILIHNAAAIRDKLLCRMDEDDWDSVMNINLKAPYYLTQKILPLLRANGADSRKGAKIFMLISRAALVGGYGISNYAASKSGLLGLTKSLARELGKKKILVNAVNPGFMKSGMTKDLPAEVIERNLREGLLHDYSDPEEVASFLVYLCSDRMSQVTGQVFHFESRPV